MDENRIVTFDDVDGDNHIYLELNLEFSDLAQVIDDLICLQQELKEKNLL